LVEQRERVVTKSELLDRVWPGLVVEESNLPVHVSNLRKLLGPGAITTIPGRGYRFTLSESAQDSAVALAAAAPEAARGAALQDPAAPDPGAGSVPLVAPGRMDAPFDADPLIGREEEVYEIVALLAEHALVDIVGAGGMGKTRLARAVMRRLREDFIDGVWWVDLTAVTQADQVGPAIAMALGLPLASTASTELTVTALARELAPRSRMLLVLDNCEQVAAAVAAWAAALLADLAPLRLLLTSRVPLHLAAEQVWRLEALTVPPVGATLEQARATGAFELFELRARSGDRRFTIDAAALPLAVALCQRLEGHALAIEMAAARAPQLGLAALLQRLDERLRLLQARDPTQPSRQLTLRATLDWSCHLLTPTQLAVLRRLAIFSGSFALELAQQVAADDQLDEWVVLDALAVLADHSLVHWVALVDNSAPGLVSDAADSAIRRIDSAAASHALPRYRLPETTRLYARELLAAAQETEATEERLRKVAVTLAAAISRNDPARERDDPSTWHLDDRATLHQVSERARQRADWSTAECIQQALTVWDSALVQSAS
jgi:predicted ATPase